MKSGRPPSISVVMPMYNAERHIERCLAPLLRMLASREIAEIIVVSDCSTDRSEELVRTHPEVRLLRTPRQGGPGVARNLGVNAATSDFAWFVDSDVIVADDAARVLVDALARCDAVAVMGSYDDRPDATNFLSQYKNLVHHYYHHRGRRDASTFWAGCGAVRRDSFLAVGGFDTDAYPYPSIEDIELGYRLRAAGGRILLIPELQGKHLKEWRLKNLLHTEIFRRAIPWSRLMLSRQGLPDDLNIGLAERLRAVLAGLLVASALLALPGWLPAWMAAPMLFAALAANFDFIRFFARTRGVAFAAGAFAYHQAYYLYSSGSFMLAWLELVLGVRRPDKRTRLPSVGHEDS